MDEQDKAILNVRNFILAENITIDNFDTFKNSLYIFNNNTYQHVASDASFDDEINYYFKEWIEVPALKGNSVVLESVIRSENDVTLEIYDEASHITQNIVLPYGDSVNLIAFAPTSKIDGDRIRTGYHFALYDEATTTTASFDIWDGFDGTGQVSKVDGISPPSGAGVDNTDVIINAVSYGRAQPSLTSAQQLTARTNINAQIAGNYISSPTDKIVGQFLTYLGNDNWTTEDIPAFPTVGSANALLMKVSDVTNDVIWTNPLSNQEIDTILAE